MNTDDQIRGIASNSPPGDDEAIAQLLLMAGPRPAAPEDVASRVRAAVYSRWRRRVDSRRTRIRRVVIVLAVAAVLVLAVGASIWRGARTSKQSAGSPTLPAPALALVDRVTGSGAIITATATAQPAALEPGSRIPAGSTIITARGSRAVLRTAGGVSFRVDGETRLRVITATRIALDAGALYVDNATSGPDRVTIDVRTPHGMVSDLGTQYEVRLEQRDLYLRVREGIVLLRRTGAEEAAAAGSEIRLDAAGTVQRRTFPVSGPAWSWAVDLAPAMAIEGQRLESFLAWASRETGWRIRFADAALARSASAIVLHGTVEGLTPAAAVEAVLPTCGLDYRIHEDTVIIGEPERRPR